MVDALTDLVGFLKGTVTENDSYYVKQIADNFSYAEDQKSFALRLVIHYVGDVHQPLHAVSEVDSTYPEGDRGGNDEHIPKENTVSNLHQIWDSVIWGYIGYETLPFSDSDWDYYTSESAKNYGDYPIDVTLLNDGDFQGWATESLQIAKDQVYAGFTTGESPSDEYRDAAKPILLTRMNYGARRLADTIVDIYGNQSSGLFLQ